MKKQRALRSFIAWTMVAFMLPWSSFVYGGNYKAEAVTVTDERAEEMTDQLPNTLQKTQGSLGIGATNDGGKETTEEVYKNSEYESIQISESITLGQDLEVDNLDITAALNLSGHTVYVHGDLTISGNGSLWFYGGTVICDGGFHVKDNGNITMNAAGDHLFVNGSATFVSSLSDNGQYVLSAGKMELKGSVSFGAAFRADKNHLIVLSGDEMQMVSQNSNSMLGTVRLENSSEAGVVLFTEFHAESLVKNGCRISMYNQEGIVGESLTDDEEIGGALILDAGTLDLCGFTLTVHGDVILNGGTIKFSGGSLVVDGDFRVQKRYVYKDDTVDYYQTNAIINMDESATLTVQGDSYVCGTKDTTFTGSTFFGGSIYVGQDSKESKLCLSGECSASQNVILNSKKGTSVLEVAGKAEIGGNLLGVNGIGCLELKKKDGEIFVQGDCIELGLSQTCDDTRIEVAGDLISEADDDDYHLWNGVLDVKGNVNAPQLRAYGTHEFVFSGDKTQTVTGASTMQFSGLCVDNASKEGVFFDGVPSKNRLDVKKGSIHYGNLEGRMGWTLKNDQEIDELTLLDGVLDLAGHTLIIHGDFVQMSGNVLLNGGRLIVEGDYRMQIPDEAAESGYGSSTASITMADESDCVTVQKDWIIDTKKQNISHEITKGAIWLEGNLTVINGSAMFYEMGNVDINLKSERNQSIDFGADTKVRKLIFHSNNEIELVNKISVLNELISDNVEHISGCVSIGTSGKITGTGFGGDLELESFQWKPYVFDDYTVGGNLCISGYAEVKGRFVVGGDLTTLHETEGLVTTSDNACIMVAGAYTAGNGSVAVSTGTLDVSGDCNIASARFIGSHRLIMSGAEKQILNVGAYGRLGTLIIENESEEGVIANNLFTVNQIQTNGNRFSYDGIDGIVGYVLEQDETINGDLVLMDGTMDLNGHMLTVEGDLIQAGGILRTNGGHLLVEGNLRQQVRKREQDQYTYLTAKSALLMKEENASVTVLGNLIIDSARSVSNPITNGVLIVGGNIEIRQNSSFSLSQDAELSFIAGKEHSIGPGYLSNLSVPILSVSTGEAGSEGDTLISGIQLNVSKELNIGDARVDQVIELNENTIITGDTVRANLQGNIYPDHSLTVDGDVKGSVSVKYPLTISGSASLRYLTIHDAELTIRGDCSIYQSIQMLSDKSGLFADGSFSCSNHKEDSLSKGTIRVGGRIFTSIQTSGSNRFVFSGTDKQEVDVQNAYFETLELNNHSEDGIYVVSTLNYGTLIENGCRVTYELGRPIATGKLESDLIVDGNAIFYGGDIDLNGHTLEIRGDLLHISGTIKFNKGSLVVEGNLREQAPYTYSPYTIDWMYASGTGVLSMMDEEDMVEVHGNLYFDMPVTSEYMSKLQAGKIHVRGDFIQGMIMRGDELNYSCGTVFVLDGDEDQRISTADTVPSFCNLELKSKGKIDLGKGVCVTESLVVECPDVSGDLSISSVDILPENYNGDIILTGSEKLQSDRSFAGRLTVKDQLNLNGHLLSVKDLVIAEEGGICMKTGMDYLLVDGDMQILTAAGESIMTDGTLEIRGDLINQKESGWIASGMHTVKLNPKQRKNGGNHIPKIDFKQSGDSDKSMLNRLLLMEPRFAYSFEQEPSKIAKEVVEADEVQGLQAVSELSADSVTESSVRITFTDPNEGGNVSGYRILRNGTEITVTGSLFYQDKKLKPETVYHYAVSIIDKNGRYGEVSEEIVVETRKDTEAPTTPGGLSIVSQTGKSIELAWGSSKDNCGVAGYRLYRNGELIFTDTLHRRSYVDTGLQSDTIYMYQIRAYDMSGNESELSEALSTTVATPKILSFAPIEYTRLGGASSNLSFTYRTYGDKKKFDPKIEIKTGETWKQVDSSTLSRYRMSGSEMVSYTWYYGSVAFDQVLVRYSVTDEDGITDTEEVTYEIDHTAPAEPRNFTVEDSNGVAVLLWDASVDADVDHYVLWRSVKTASDTTPVSDLVYEKRAEIVKGRTRYEDNTVSEGDTAYYILSVVDDLGNASPLLHPVSVQIGKDKRAPEVTELTPETGVIGNSITLSATAKDNKGVQGFRFAYKAEDEEEWTDFGTGNAAPVQLAESSANTAAVAYATTEYRWTLPRLKPGAYVVRVTAFDASGNESEGFTRRYTVDQSQPGAPKITKTNVGSTYVQLMWEESEGTEVDRYVVYMYGGDATSFRSIGYSDQVLGFTKTGLEPGTKYHFYVCAYSETGIMGERSEIVEVTTNPDETMPIISAVGPASGYAQDKLELYATVEDNDKVDRLVWSYSTDGESYTELPSPTVSYSMPASIEQFGVSGQRKTFRYTLDIADASVFPEGPLYIKTEAWDVAGNKAKGTNGDIVVEYRIDHTAPAAPEHLKAESGDGYISLSWDQGTEEDLASYQVYRSEAGLDRYGMVKSGNILNYYDSVTPETVYQYYICAVDQAGNISEKSNVVAASALPDETEPVIHGVSPVTDSVVGKEPVITIAVTDNAGFKKLRIDAKRIDDEASPWTCISEKPLQGSWEKSDFTLNFSDFDETDYRLRFVAEDMAGNQSEPFYVNYTIDKTAPTGSLTATGGHFVVDLALKHDTKKYGTNDGFVNGLPGTPSGGAQSVDEDGSRLKELLKNAGIENNEKEDDFAYYEIYRAELSTARTDYAFYSNAKVISKTINDEYQDKAISPHVAYRYSAKVYDTHGNWRWTGISDAIADSVDVEAPEISVTKRITVATDMYLPLDAGNCKDNVKIRSFRWEMGNGDVVTGVRPRYAYKKAGTYRIKLTVTDTAGNKAEETIEARILEPTRSGVVYLHVVDEKGSPIPYATYYVKNGSEQTTPCMADETGVITLVYPAGTYTVAVFRDGYMPAEHDVEIETLLEKDDFIPLFEGDVVIGEFHVERLSLQEMIDQGVDLSDPANVNTFTFKTTLTFQQEPIPISWDTREGDIILDMNQDNVKPGGFGTISHSGGGGGTEEGPKPDSPKPKVTVSVVGPTEAPVIAILTTTQSVSWLKSMYQATLTVANTADSKYVLEDSTAEIHLPEGVSLAALTWSGERTEERILIHEDQTTSKTLHFSGDTELIHLGDIPGQEQRSASWILKGDKSGTYQLEAEFNGLLTPFNVLIKKVFRTEETMQVPQANVRITVMPEETAFCDDTYFIQYAITNEGSEPLYNFKTSIGDYKMPGQRYAVAEIDEKTGIVIPVSDTGNSIVYELPVSEQIYHMPVLSHGDRISIPTLLPGQTIYGTWHSGIPDAAGNTGTEFGGDPYTQYYELISSVVEVIEGENLGVHVEIDPIPSHTTKVLLAHCTESDVYLKLGDPVDLASGSFTETSEGLSITGHDTLSFGLSYDSVLAGMTPDQSAASRKTGAGWTGNYQSYIREENGMIFYQMNPYISASFISEEAYGGKGKGSVSVTGDTSTVDLQEEPDVEKEELSFVSVTRGMDGFVLIRHTDGTYTLEMPSGESQDFDSDGRLSRLTTAEGRAVSVRQSRNQTILTEDLTGTRLILTYDDEERLISVSDDTGRKTQYLYTGDDLTKVINPLGESTTYVYDEKHRIIEEKDDEGYVVLTNTYDEDGRVVSQKDMAGIETTFAYVPDGKGGSTNTATRKQPGYDPVSTSVTVNAGEQIISATTAAGLTETYTYGSAGNMISSTDGYGNVRTYAYDETGRLLSSTDPEGQTMTVRYENGNPVEISDGKTTTRYSYDSRGLLLHADQNGAVTDYTYDDSGILKTINRKGLGTTTYEITNGRITGETNPLGGTVQYAYDAVGNLTGFTDARGGKLQYTYDLLGRKTAETDALGNTTRYTFDSYGRCDSKTDPSGAVTKYRYDMAGHLICIVQPDGAEQKYNYDAAGHITAWTRPDGSKLTYETDYFGQITKVTYPNGTTEQRFYDTAGNLTRSIDAAGQETTYSYDNRQRLTGRKDANGRTTKLTYNTDGSVQSASVDELKESYTYDATGHMTSVTDLIGNTETYTYDVWGRCLTETDVRGNVTKYTYDAVGNCTKAELPTGVVVESTYDAGCYLTEQSAYIPSRKETLREKYTYDAAGNVTMFMDVTGRQEKYAYDSCGRLAKTTYSDGTTEEYTYDTMGRTVSVLSSSGAKTRYTYDALGRVTKAESIGRTTDMATDGPKSKIWTYAYDNMDRVTEVTDPEDYKTSQTYDAFGNTTSLTDAKGGTTTYAYDDHSNLISTTNAIGVTKTYEYDEKDRLVKSVNGRRQETTYTYDAYDRLVSTQDELGITEYVYSQYGELTEVKDSAGSIIRTYDTLGRVTEVTDYNGKTVKYGYDELGNRISLTYAGGEIVRYAYRADGLLESVTDGDGRVTRYTYDSAGRLLTTVRPDGATETYSYDKDGSLIKLETKQKDGTVLQSYSYTYDGFGNIVKTEEISAYKMPVADYSKESDGYQASVTRGRESDTEEDNETESASENHEEVSEVITTSTMEYNEANQLIRFNGEEVTYDEDGNMLHGPLNGEMADFTYDCRNRLISAGDTKYFYDAEDVRIRVETLDYTEVYTTDRESDLSQTLELERTRKNGESEHSRFYYGIGLLYESVSSGSTTSTATTASKKEASRFYHFDYLGSTRWITDETGKPQYGFRYGTYGEFLSVWRATEKTPEALELSDLTVPVRFLYNGELGVVTDDNSLLYMRQRYYDTEIKRFINQDILTGSIGDSQSLNRYAYVQGNPVSYSDPFGLSPFERLRQAFRPLHAVLNIAGIIPGPIGMLASLAQAGLYGLEGNSALAAHYLGQSLMIGLAGPVGGAVLGALSKMGPAAKVILGTVLGAQSLYTAGVAGINLYNSASTIADGLLNGDMSWLDAFCEGSMALNSAAGIYYSLKGLVNSCELTLKGLDDVAAKYAAKQEAWYKEHAGSVQDGCSIGMGSYTDRNTGQIVEVGACFIAGTKVQTPDGEKNIEDIQVGDRVYAHNTETGETGIKEVKNAFVREVNTLVHVFVGEEEIITTTNHPFYVVGEGFVQAGDLKVDSSLLLLDGTTEKVSRIYVEALQTPVKVYNFEVEDWHTYYVSEEACLVHNLCGVGGRKTGTYKELREAGYKDAHHIIQDAAVKDIEGYNKGSAPAIQLEGPSNQVGTEHYIATTVQRQGGGGTYGQERGIAYKALRKAGFSIEESKAYVRYADNYFMGELGLTLDSPTRIPGNRKGH